MSEHIAVIGGGVIGLVQSLLLAEKGYDVTIFSDQSPYATTTIAAGAIWMPYKALPEDNVLHWAESSLAYYREAAKSPSSGVFFYTHTEFFNKPTDKPRWMNLLPLGELPNCVVPTGASCHYSVELPVIDTHQFVGYLLASLMKLGVPLISRHIEHINQLKEFSIIVNAAGVGASSIAQDNSVFPIKGQTFTLTQPTLKITQSVFYDNNGLITLVVPHEKHVTIGVTVHEHDHSMTYNHAEEKALLGSAIKFFPRLAQSQILARRVGIRPGRTEGIRLEEEYSLTEEKWLLHNYGHAGGGITLAPGCAYDVLNRIQSLTKTISRRE